MQQVLKQSTAATTIVGPILDSTGAEFTTALIADLNITKNGATLPMAAAATLTHSHNGHYLLAFTTGNTDTLGRLDITCNRATCAMPPKTFEVLSAAAFDIIVTNGDMASRTNITAGTITTVTTTTNLTTNNDKTGYTLSAAGVQAVWDALSSALSTVGSIGKRIVDFLTGDAFARIGAPVGASLSVDLQAVKTETAALVARLTVARAGYLDNLNVAGVVATQADINALNQSASRRVILTTVPAYERPETSSSTFTIEARTYGRDGNIVNADVTPTLTATGITSGSLAANLSAASNPATGVYRWTYTVTSGATLEQIRFDLAATVETDSTPMAVYSQTTDAVSVDYTSADRTRDDAIKAALDAKLDVAVSTRGTSTLTQTQVTGGAYPLSSSSFFFHSSMDLTTTQKVSTAASVWGAGSAAMIAIGPGTMAYVLDAYLSNMPSAILDEDLELHVVEGSLSMYTRNAGQNIGLIKQKTDQFVFTVAGRVDSTVIDKTSFTLAASQAFNNTGTWTGNIVGTVSTVTTYTGNTPQSGDVYAKFSTMVSLSGAAWVFTVPALANAPTGGGGGGGGGDETFDVREEQVEITEG